MDNRNSFKIAQEKLLKIEQSHILKYWEGLDNDQKNQLLFQIEKIDLKTFDLQQKLLRPTLSENHKIEPFNNYAQSGNLDDIQKGKELISQGLVGTLVVAGGQGSRLRLDGPKGLFPITTVKHKSLFQLLAEKTLAASKQAGRPLPLAIMTSPLNHDITVEYFEKNHLFGLLKEQISFFPQGMLPLLDTKGFLFLENPYSIAEGPDGNGGALHEFARSGLWLKWHKQGIRYLNFILIDNPLADPFDAELIGYHARTQSEIVVKCIKRNDPKEKVGVIVRQNGKVTVVEYSEIDESERFATQQNGTLLHLCANLSLFSFSMDFIKTHIVNDPTPLPLHAAFKAAKHLDPTGNSVLSDKPIAWKFEHFIFDVLPRANKINALLYPRETCFAPLKNFSGEDSIETVRAALESSDRRVVSEITGTPCTVSPLEISQQFYYPTPSLLAKWKGKEIKQVGYLNS